MTPTPPLPHPVHVGPVADHLPGLLARLEPSAAFVLVDSNTAGACLPILRREVPAFAKTEVIQIPAGELDKTIASASTVWERLVTARADRHALLLNLGGGVVTDLGGFAAGCYKRGIRFVHVPTTVLGQVDAALGGKTGVDFGGVKNSVGLFRMPEAVVADPQFLRTLPPREVRSGMAEMYKHALISDPAHWFRLQRTRGELLGQDDGAELIARSQAIKLDVVRADPEERGVRESLNFGHSVGHAIESVLLTGTNPALHGEAVAAGMICEAYASEELTGLSGAEVLDIERTLLAVYGKLRIAPNQLASVISLVANDKKNRGGATRMSLLRRIGEPRLGVRVDDRAVGRALARYAKTSLPR